MSKSPPEEFPTVIVCMPADSPYTSEESRFDRTCSKCGQAVMTAPSTERFVGKNPGLIILCHPCFVKNAPRNSQPQFVAPLEEIFDDLRLATKNPKARRSE